MSEPRIGFLVSRVRAEEKLLLAAFRARDVEPDLIDDGGLALDLLNPDPRLTACDLVLQRSVSATRALLTARVLESWGVRVVNTEGVIRTCADKVLTTLALAEEGVPQPPVRLAYTPGAALEAIEELGYPAILKPPVGSWGRLLAKVNDREAAEAVLEHRQTLGSFPHHVYYVQGYVEKAGGRDIRAFVMGDETVCAIYRTSPHWITNTAQGGVASNCPVTPELDAICRAAARAVGGGMLAIDVFEREGQGFLVNEVNHSMEFRNSSQPTGVDIPARAADYVLRLAAEAIGDRQTAGAVA